MELDKLNKGIIFFMSNRMFISYFLLNLTDKRTTARPLSLMLQYVQVCNFPRKKPKPTNFQISASMTFLCCPVYFITLRNYITLHS